MSTTAKSKNSRKTPRPTPKTSKAIDRPFARSVIARAKAAVADYQVVIWFEDGEWYGTGVEVPGANGDGATPAACIKNVQESMIALVAYAIEQGEEPPAPAREGLRTLQVNVRLSPSEKLTLESRARQGGHAGVSDYVRSVALAK